MKITATNIQPQKANKDFSKPFKPILPDGRFKLKGDTVSFNVNRKVFIKPKYFTPKMKDVTVNGSLERGGLLGLKNVNVLGDVKVKEGFTATDGFKARSLKSTNSFLLTGHNAHIKNDTVAKEFIWTYKNSFFGGDIISENSSVDIKGPAQIIGSVKAEKDLTIGAGVKIEKDACAEKFPIIIKGDGNVGGTVKTGGAAIKIDKITKIGQIEFTTGGNKSLYLNTTAIPEKIPVILSELVEDLTIYVKLNCNNEFLKNLEFFVKNPAGTLTKLESNSAKILYKNLIQFI